VAKNGNKFECKMSFVEIKGCINCEFLGTKFSFTSPCKMCYKNSNWEYNQNLTFTKKGVKNKK